VLAGCEAPRPDVTFFGNRSAVQTAPTHWCDVDETASTVSCTETAVEDVPRLSLRPGQQVQINVPGAVGSTPWTVYFRYLDAKGELADGRSEVFSDGRLAYTLQPLTPEDQLTYVEVQSAFVLVPAIREASISPPPAPGCCWSTRCRQRARHSNSPSTALAACPDDVGRTAPGISRHVARSGLQFGRHRPQHLGHPRADGTIRVPTPSQVRQRLGFQQLDHVVNQAV